MPPRLSYAAPPALRAPLPQPREPARGRAGARRALAHGGARSRGRAAVGSAWLAVGVALGARERGARAADHARAPPQGDGGSPRARLHASLGVATLLVALGVLASWALSPARTAAPRPALDAALVRALFRARSPSASARSPRYAGLGLHLGQRRIEVTTTRVPLPKLHPISTGLRIVQISDLHIGNRLAPRGSTAWSSAPTRRAPTSSCSPATCSTSTRGTSTTARGASARCARARRLRDPRQPRPLRRRRARRGGARAPRARHPAAARRARAAAARRAALSRGRRGPGRALVRARLRSTAIDTLARRRPGDGPVVLLVHQPEVFQHAARRGYPSCSRATPTAASRAASGAAGINLARVMTPLTRGAYRRGRRSCT